jgi:hypothetical protein
MTQAKEVIECGLLGLGPVAAVAVVNHAASFDMSSLFAEELIINTILQTIVLLLGGISAALGIYLAIKRIKGPKE